MGLLDTDRHFRFHSLAMNPITTAFCLRSPMNQARWAKAGSRQNPVPFSPIGQLFPTHQPALIRAAARTIQNRIPPTQRAGAYAHKLSNHLPCSDA